MTIEEFQWLVGIGVTLFLAIGGIAITAFRATSTKLDGAVADMSKAVREGDETLHERINRVRDEMGNNYVRRVDLETHMKRMDDTLKELRDDQKEMMRIVVSLDAGRPRPR